MLKPKHKVYLPGLKFYDNEANEAVFCFLIFLALYKFNRGNVAKELTSDLLIIVIIY